MGDHMKTEVSCGAVVFTITGGVVKYVIVQSKAGVYGFPKGHVEASETYRETALREILEETGLHVAIIDGFQKEDMYTFTHDGMCILKKVVYYLAQFCNQIPNVQETELMGIHLLSIDEALNWISYDGTKSIIKEAHDYITKKLKA